MQDIPKHLAEALAGKYEPTREIGRGGMATVYLARDLRHNRDVAVKVLKPDLRASIGVDRFLREIQIAAQLTHPHILPLIDSGDKNEVLHYVMPYIKDESLRGLLLRVGRSDLPTTVRLIREVGSALSYAHRQGVVHRDIKPENILLSDGHAVVADFGIAKAVFSAAAGNLTRTGFPLGTPGYMSPEQAAGRTELDERSDVYSLACVAFEMLIGDVPGMWVTEDDARMLRFMDAPPHQRELLDALPGSVEQVLVVAMALRSRHRFASPDRFAEALEDATKGKRDLPEAAAHEIIGRAAALQAAREAEGDKYSLAGLQRIGAEVDIPPTYVRQAALLGDGGTEPLKEGLFGYTPKIQMQRTVDGEIPEADVEDFIEEVRMVMGEVGRVNPQVGRSYSWNSLSFQNTFEGNGRLTHVMVTPRDGKTRVRITESAGHLTGVAVGMVGAVGFVAFSALGVLANNASVTGVAVVAAAGGIGAGYYGVRKAFQALIKRRYRVLGGLVDSVTARAQRARPARLEDRVEADTPV